MKKMRYTFFCSLLIAAFIGLGVTGCDDDADTSSADNYSYSSYGSHSSTKTTTLSITPAAGVVSFAGQQFAFRAVGGTSPYHWGLGNSSLGTISQGGSGNSYGVYKASQVAANTVIVYDSVNKAAVATITKSTDAPSNGTTQVTLNYAQVSLPRDGDLVALKASGGVAGYKWTVKDTTLGQISANTGNTIVYERYHAGDNSVTVTDAVGDKDTVVIKQP